MHATADIPEGTPLVVLPRKYVLESKDERYVGTQHNVHETPKMCVTVKRMLDELESENSFYSPYLSYLFEDTSGGTSRGLLPHTWSPESREILELLLGHNTDSKLSPETIQYEKVFEHCKTIVDFGIDAYPEESMKNQRIQLVTDAYFFLLSRGWFDKLIPIIDMFNHRNGKHRNVEVTAIEDEEHDIAAYATRDIQKGEQLQYTYSECMDRTCDFSNLRYTYTLQHILIEYGFIELYPQRWEIDTFLTPPKEILLVDEGGPDHQEYLPVDPSLSDESILVPLESLYPGTPYQVTDKDEIDDDDDEDVEWVLVSAAKLQELCVEVDEDETTKEIVLRWIFEAPNKYTLRYIENQLSRLTSIQSELHERIAASSSAIDTNGIVAYNRQHETHTILELYQQYVQMLQLALKHKDDPVAVTMDDLLKDIEYRKATQGQRTIQELRRHEVMLSARPKQQSNNNEL